MSVIVILLGGLGNNLFQYAVGRYIAARCGAELICIQTDGQGAWTDGGATLPGLGKYFPRAPLYVPGRRTCSPVTRYCLGITPSWDGHTIDLDTVINIAKTAQVRLGGFFQQFRYLVPMMDELQQWYALAPVETPYNINPEDVLVNIRRRDDYVRLGWSLAASYYIKTLLQVRHVGKVYVCGIGIDNDIRTALAPFRPIYMHGGPIQHFAFIQRFRRVILSNSTFAWWAGFLSKATEIYAPRTVIETRYAFTGYRSIDLHMREARYIEIDAEFDTDQRGK